MNDKNRNAQTVLLVSNCTLDDNVGRAEKFASRKRLLAQHGWELEIGYVEPTVSGLIDGSIRCIRKARHADVLNSVSNPPHLQIAGAIAANVTGTPWLAEFRDPLVENPDVSEGSMAARLRKQIERYILTHADRTVYYEGIQIPKGYFAEEYPNVASDAWEQLPPIGFDLDKFESVSPKYFDEFTITYAGSFYEGWIEPYDFFNAFEKYIEQSDNTDIEGRFYGDWDDNYTTAASKLSIADHITPHPFIQHKEIVRVMKGSDVLLYIGGTDPRNRRNLPTKLYDYIGAGQPILALVDPSFRVADVVVSKGFGIVAHPDNPEAISEAIKQIRTGSFKYDPDPKSIRKFTRQHNTDAYVSILDSIANQ